MMDEKIFHGLSCTSIKTIQFDIQNGITWPKKCGKGREGGMERGMGQSLYGF
jgi:hypothetical protein